MSRHDECCGTCPRFEICVLSEDFPVSGDPGQGATPGKYED